MAVVALSLVIGSRVLGLDEVWHGLTTAHSVGDDSVVRRLRVPRTAIGLLAGIALGLSGAIMQAVTRNPLADPGLLGVNAGATLCVVLASWLFGIGSVLGLVWFALAGAAVASVAVYAIGTAGRGGASPVRLALAGVAVTAVLNGIVQVTLLRDPLTFERFRFWRVGSLTRADGAMVWQLLPFVVVGTLIALSLGRLLNAVALGDDMARSLGGSVRRTRAASVIAVTLLCGAATAAVGPISFVGLMIPHIARRIVGPDQRWILAYTVVLAPLLLVTADIVGRLVVRPAELQVGLVTALLGAPVLVWVVRRGRLSEL
ncbi:FecCD family ABC transporter permease [Luteipulveratus mongoliensis]|uniref:FecCD family ABC transporter permease n=1 Tax=Luteipulveratus mongoliensis TaxID=571913 RepID=UPI000A6DA449|nr:iron chelate uptake ABC transporter family permease subunit [Luteipulveratus mongoliensis]